MNKLWALTVFAEIADRGSLTAAAKSLGKSLPTVVRVLASLEDSLQTRLFNRTTRRVVLTGEGRLYLDHCRKVLAAVEEADLSLGREQVEPSGVVTVTAPVRLGEMHVEPLLALLLARYPKVKVRLLLLDRVTDLLEEGIDVAVRIARLQDSSLIAKPVGLIRQVVCASPRLLAQLGEPDRPKELAALPCVMFTGISAGTAWTFVENGRAITVEIGGRFQCNHIGASIDACVRGLGFGRFYCYQVMPAVRRGDLGSCWRNTSPRRRRSRWSSRTAGCRRPGYGPWSTGSQTGFATPWLPLRWRPRGPGGRLAVERAGHGLITCVTQVTRLWIARWSEPRWPDDPAPSPARSTSSAMAWSLLILRDVFLGAHRFARSRAASRHRAKHPDDPPREADSARVARATRLLPAATAVRVRAHREGRRCPAGVAHARRVGEPMARPSTASARDRRCPYGADRWTRCSSTGEPASRCCAGDVAVVAGPGAPRSLRAQLATPRVFAGRSAS